MFKSFKVFWSRLFTPSNQLPLVILDLKTTGLGIHNNNLLEIGLIAVDKHLAIKQTLTIPVKLNGRAHWGEAAAKVHKITEEAARKQGVELSEALNMVDDFLNENYDETPIPVGFNPNFDMKLIETAYEKKKRKHPFSHTVYDLNTVGKYLFNINSSRFLVPHLGIEVDEDKKHSALYDCELALKTLRRLERIK